MSVTKFRKTRTPRDNTNKMMLKEYKQLLSVDDPRAKVVSDQVLQCIRQELHESMIVARLKIHSGVLDYVKKQNGLLQRGEMVGADITEIQARNLHEKQCKNTGVEVTPTAQWRREYARQAAPLAPAVAEDELPADVREFLTANGGVVSNIRDMLRKMAAGKAGHLRVDFGGFCERGSGVKLD